MAEDIKKAAKKFKPIDQETFLQVAQDYKNVRQKKDDGNTRHASFFKDAEKRYGIHRKAFKDAMELEHMSSEKRQDYLRGLNQYLDHLGINLQPDLLDQDKREAGETGAAEAKRITAGNNGQGGGTGAHAAK